KHEEAGQHGDDHDSDIEALLPDKRFVLGSNNGDVLTLFKVSLNLGEVADQLFTIYAILKIDVFVLVRRCFFEISSRRVKIRERTEHANSQFRVVERFEYRLCLLQELDGAIIVTRSYAHHVQAVQVLSFPSLLRWRYRTTSKNDDRPLQGCRGLSLLNQVYSRSDLDALAYIDPDSM